MTTIDPSEFAKQFREELIADLGFSPSILCPKCCITYIGEYDDCCRYERIDSESGSESDLEEDEDEVITKEILEKKYRLACVFEYYGTDMKELLNEWAEKLLKDCYRIGGDELKQKWEQKINAALALA